MSEKLKIYVLPKVEFHNILKKYEIDDDNVDEFIKYAFISINDTSGKYYHEPLFKEDHGNVLTLFFDDVENDLERSPTNKNVCKSFSEDQAKQVLTFLNQNKDVETILVHCAAGISRSGAIGQFALDFLKGDKDFFRITNKYIMPNSKVLRLLNQETRK